MEPRCTLYRCVKVLVSFLFLQMLMGMVGTFWDGGVEMLLEAVVSRFLWCNSCVDSTLERCVREVTFSIVVIGMSGQYLKIHSTHLHTFFRHHYIHPYKYRNSCLLSPYK